MAGPFGGSRESGVGPDQAREEEGVQGGGPLACWPWRTEGQACGLQSQGVQVGTLVPHLPS